MATVNLSEEFYKSAQLYGKIYHRSIPKQIEYWATIGKIAEENQDLPYSLIKDIMLALKEMEDGQVTSFEFN